MLRGALLIALAATSWGTTGSVAAILVARAGAHPLAIGAVRMALAAILLVAGARLGAGTLRVARGDRLRCLAAGTAMAGYQAAYFTAVPLSGIAVTALVAICSAPVLIALLAATALGERLTIRTALGLALGVAGTALLMRGRGEPEGAPHLAAGVALALAAALAYAVYVVVTKAGLAATPPLPLTAATFAIAAALMAPALASGQAPLRALALGWPWLLYLGGVATAGAYALYSAGLTRVPASLAGVVSLMEPLTATALGVLVFGERLGPARTAGAVLLVAGLAVVLGAGIRRR